jgi:hypothetical protein
MPTLFDGGNFRITMYFRDHLPPHSHVLTKEDEALLRISNLQIIAGWVPAKILRQAKAWASANKQSLTACWERMHS